MSNEQKFALKRFLFTAIPIVAVLQLFVLSSCEFTKKTPRLAMFVGVDISGSFIGSSQFDDSLLFLATYIHTHLNGKGGAEKPKDLFVGSIGGEKPNEPKTFLPIHVFEDKSIQEIQQKLKGLFPKSKKNEYTDFNAFFKHISETIKNRKMILRPISVVMLTDGKPDHPKWKGSMDQKFRQIDLSPLEGISRNVTVRVLYTNAVVGNKWQTQIPRKRVKVWTADAKVMKYWSSFPTRPKFHRWLRDSVDFEVRSRRVD